MKLALQILFYLSLAQIVFCAALIVVAWIGRKRGDF